MFPSKLRYMFIIIAGAEDNDGSKFAAAGKKWGSRVVLMEKIIGIALQATTTEIQGFSQTIPGFMSRNRE